MLFSATMPEEVMRFADALAPNAVFIQVGSRRGPAQTISHEARILPAREKATFLAKYLRRSHDRRSSSSTRRSAAIAWRGSSSRRACARPPFTPIGRRRIARPRLRASAPAARRCSSPPTSPRAASTSTSVGLIVNYEVPHTLDTYVHRVGRTGRNDATGHALTLAEPGERHDLEQIEKAFGLKLLSE